MGDSLLGVPWVLLSGIMWAIAAQIFAWAGGKIGVLRLNFIKSWVAWPLFLLLCLYFRQPIPQGDALGYLLISGVLGYTIGDFFLFLSFVKLGPSRALVLESFGPVILAILSFLLLNLPLGTKQLIAICFLVFSLFLYALERSKGLVSFKTHHVFLALLGIGLDSLGLIFSKKAFMLDPQLSSSMASAVRITTAVVAYTLVRLCFRHHFTVSINKKDFSIIALAAFFGTFLALLFYLKGLTTMHPALVGALGSLAPIYSTLIESIRGRKIPSWYFMGSIICMVSALFALTML